MLHFANKGALSPADVRTAANSLHVDPQADAKPDTVAAGGTSAAAAQGAAATPTGQAAAAPQGSAPPSATPAGTAQPSAAPSADAAAPAQPMVVDANQPVDQKQQSLTTGIEVPPEIRGLMEQHIDFLDSAGAEGCCLHLLLFAVSQAEIFVQIYMLVQSYLALLVQIAQHQNTHTKIPTARHHECHSSLCSPFHLRPSSLLSTAGSLCVADLVGSLREYAHVDPHVAYHLWVLVFPIVWATLQKTEQINLAKPIISLMSKEYHQRQASCRPNIMQVGAAATASCCCWTGRPRQPF